jgi:hypothetical protein
MLLKDVIDSPSPYPERAVKTNPGDDFKLPGNSLEKQVLILTRFPLQAIKSG